MSFQKESGSLSPQPRLLNRNQQKELLNSRVVMLIKEKLLPLNRGRYEHLRKIHQAIKTEQVSYIEAFMQNLTTQQSQSKIEKKKGFTAREVYSEAATDLLLTRLKSMKKLDEPNSLNLKKQPSYKCWDNLQRDIADSEMSSTWKISTPEGKQRVGKRREPLFDLVVRAEKHLRLKKHQLKERYRQKDAQRRTIGKVTQLQSMISKLAGARVKGSAEQQLQKQLLKDIRLNMLQEKMNKLKKDINHKKIVQLR